LPDSELTDNEIWILCEDDELEKIKLQVYSIETKGGKKTVLMKDRIESKDPSFYNCKIELD